MKKELCIVGLLIVGQLGAMDSPGKEVAPRKRVALQRRGSSSELKALDAAMKGDFPGKNIEPLLRKLLKKDVKVGDLREKLGRVRERNVWCSCCCGLCVGGVLPSFIYFLAGCKIYCGK